MKINDRIYCYIWQGMGNNCNTILFPHVLEGSRPHLLIDPGHTFNEFKTDCLASLSQAMQQHKFKLDDVGMIINTHCHADHCEACEPLSRDNSMAIALSEEEEEFRHGGNLRLNAMFGIRSPEFKTSHVLREGAYRPGKEGPEFEVFISPGHSPGSVCLYVPEEKVLITGDVIFYGSIGRTDFPGGDINQLQASIERLSKLDIECIIPGHCTELGSVITGRRNIERNFNAIKMFF
jgi:glyoxylase-like metal-dependent hydrolase (beta-lactamase superfamily II)